MKQTPSARREGGRHNLYVAAHHWTKQERSARNQAKSRPASAMAKVNAAPGGGATKRSAPPFSDFPRPHKFHASVSMPTQKPVANAVLGAWARMGAGNFMRSAIAGLRRQALLAALACAVVVGAVTVVSRSAPFHAAVGQVFAKPILVKSVALDRPPLVNPPKASDPPAILRQVSAPTPAPAKAPNPAARHACAIPPCQRLAALAPAPPRRPAAHPVAPMVEAAALTTPASGDDKGAHSLSDRLLWPVGAMRDRMVGLISSL
jgi:hypothetical protein